MNSGRTVRDDRPLPPPVMSVVGIGASAGGLEAFNRLLKALAPDTGMTFVLVSHMRHEQKSVLSDLLSKATSMPVTQLKGRTLMKPNHVYIIPPDKALLTDDGYLDITDLAVAESSPTVIDSFFHSLGTSFRKTHREAIQDRHAAC
jgi:two-component system, chemotaxis family, CheB/CheR fusion protein